MDAPRRFDRDGSVIGSSLTGSSEGREGVAMTSSPPPFVVTCAAQFRDDGVWIIQATLRFRDGRPADASDLLAEGRLALLQAIVREGLRGRTLGATDARVFMDEGSGEV